MSVDSIDEILNVGLYFQEDNENELIEMLKDFMASSRHKTLVVQRRYLKGSPSKLVVGELADDIFVVENGMKIKLNLLSNKNNGYFPDMKYSFGLFKLS